MLLYKMSNNFDPIYENVHVDVTNVLDIVKKLMQAWFCVKSNKIHQKIFSLKFDVKNKFEEKANFLKFFNVNQSYG